MRPACVEVHKLKEEEERKRCSLKIDSSRSLTLVILTSQDDQCLTSSCGTRGDTWDEALLKYTVTNVRCLFMTGEDLIEELPLLVSQWTQTS